MKKWSRVVSFIVIVLVASWFMLATTSGIAQKINLGLDLQGGFEILYQLEPMQEGEAVTKDLLNVTATMIDKRVNIGGVKEPEVTIENPDRIRVKLAGVTNEDTLRDLIGKPAVLTFRDEQGRTVMEGRDLAPNGASVDFDDLKRPLIVLKFADAQKFADVTKNNLHKNVAIYLDDEMLTNPVIEEVITAGKAQIRGQHSLEEAKQLRDILNSGALPAKLVELQTNSVGASLGAMALEKTLFAGYVGFGVVLLFMLWMYRLPGMIANITLVFFTYICLLVLSWMNATLTLTGIAGFILSVGMAVDANIITYERIQEELRSHKTALSAFRTGQRRSFITILDSHVTTIIAALVLMAFGSSSIQGFSTILIMTLIVSLFTNVFGSRWLLSLLLKANLFKRPEWYGVAKRDIGEREDAQLVRFDIVKRRRSFYVLSTSILVLGLCSMFYFGLHVGVDFKAGTRLDMYIGKEFHSAEIETVLNQKVPESEFKPVVKYGSKNEWATTTFEKPINKLELEEIQKSLKQNYGNQVNMQESTVDPMIADEMVKKAAIAVILAAVGITIYIAIRFQFLFGIACIVALLHDVFVPLALFSLFQLEIDLTFIAAILTIVGFSINDTIVIFDRIRENMRNRKVKTFEELQQLVNVSLWQTMRRSVFTVLTVFITVMAIALYGSEGVYHFSLALIFGLISGTYSSIFIAAQVWVSLKKREFRTQKALAEKELAK
ncbi:protein translocase subunit SecD [Brevibacillus reuszeri]|uniref:protein translocase subunit SecD n=1 Tax=Brevibacillus reuszeri TaxID=54915 RepID=UPI00289B8967|nr:protein translocase subunit SecD [Brevibacillus reuszeri]